MKLSKKIYYEVCSLIPTSLLKKWASPSTLLPYHHLVSDQDVLHVKHLYPYKNIRQFKKDLDLLLKYYRPVGVDEINKSVSDRKPLPQNAFLLSFDDGFKEVHDIIAPILLAKGLPAIFFINPAFIDNKVLFYRCKISLIIEKLIQKKDDPSIVKSCETVFGPIRLKNFEELIGSVKKINNSNKHLLDELGEKIEISFVDYLEKQLPFLSLPQLKSLDKSGFSIGAHSIDHPYYDIISRDEQKVQTIESCNYIQNNLPAGPVLFSFPHSDVNLPQTFFDEIKNEKPHIDLFFGIQNQKSELNNRVLHRFNAERPDLPMNRQLNGLLMLMATRRILGRNFVVRYSL